MRSLIVSSVLAATLCGAAPAPAANEGIKVPLAERKALTRATGAVDPKSYFAQMQWAIQKYDHSFKLPFKVSDLIGKRAEKRATANEGLKAQVEDGVEELYYGPITVGTKGPQTFLCDFDTGSADLFVPGPKCTTANGCPTNPKYDQQGTDEHNTTTVTYGSGMISGENYFDDVTVAGLTAKKTNVISLTTATGFAGSDAGSLMGMAFSTIANSMQPTYFENLMSQKVVTNPEFSFFLGRAADGTAQNSELTLGGQDSKHYTGAITKVPVTQKGYWQVALDQVIVNGKPGLLTSTTKGQAAIDTGTTIILAPTVAATAIYSQIPGSFPVPVAGGVGGPTVFAYPCSAKPKVAIQFAGKSFAIDPRDFNIGSLTSDFASFLGKDNLIDKLTGGGYCLGAIAGFDIDPTENLYVVGDTFLKNWYSIFNYKNANGGPSVSFAKSK